MYKIQPFIWQKISLEKVVFQTKNSTVVITNKLLIDFLIEIEKKMILEIDDIYLNAYFGEEKSSDIKDFLLENNLLKSNTKKNININRIIIVSNNKEFSKAVKFNLNKMQKFIFINITMLRKFNFFDNDLVIIFLNPFGLKLLEEITTIVKEKNLLVKNIFAYNNKIYFSNFYKKEWYNPCPLCFFYELESQLYSGSVVKTKI